MLTHRQVEFLLEELCVVYGLCLNPDAWERLVVETPPDPESFARAVFKAEGIEPAPSYRKLYRMVLAHVEAAYARAAARAT